MMVISAGTYRGASLGRKVCGPVQRCISQSSANQRLADCEWLRTNDVASTVPNEIHCSDCSLLGVSRDVTRNQAQQRHEWRRTSLRQVVSRQTARAVAQGQGDDEYHAEYSSTETNH